MKALVLVSGLFLSAVFGVVAVSCILGTEMTLLELLG
jgi:hypothetical protein